MMRYGLIFIALFALWLLFSGLYYTWFISSGAVLSAAVVWLLARNRLIDAEAFPHEKLPRVLVYMPWLIGQIFLSALNVTRILLSPGLPITPTLTRVDAEARSPVGLTAYANSITLTPGTISVEVSEQRRQVWVHALTRENADGLQTDRMNAYAAWLDGRDG